VARKIRQTRFVLDGEAVILGDDGIADFNALHSRLHAPVVSILTASLSEKPALAVFRVAVEEWAAQRLGRLPLASLGVLLAVEDGAAQRLV
jgi:hypothetical protein